MLKATIADPASAGNPGTAHVTVDARSGTGENPVDPRTLTGILDLDTDAASVASETPIAVYEHAAIVGERRHHRSLSESVLTHKSRSAAATSSAAAANIQASMRIPNRGLRAADRDS